MLVLFESWLPSDKLESLWKGIRSSGFDGQPRLVFTDILMFFRDRLRTLLCGKRNTRLSRAWNQYGFCHAKRFLVTQARLSRHICNQRIRCICLLWSFVLTLDTIPGSDSHTFTRCTTTQTVLQSTCVDQVLQTCRPFIWLFFFSLSLSLGFLWNTVQIQSLVWSIDLYMLHSKPTNVKIKAWQNTINHSYSCRRRRQPNAKAPSLTFDPMWPLQSRDSDSPWRHACFCSPTALPPLACFLTPHFSDSTMMDACWTSSRGSQRRRGCSSYLKTLSCPIRSLATSWKKQSSGEASVARGARWALP